MQQQNKAVILIALAGLGLIAGVFGLVAWVTGGGGGAPSPSLQSDKSETTANDAALAASLGTGQDVPTGLFNYGGSTTWIPVHESVNHAIATAFPDFKLRYTFPSSGTPGSGSGIKMLLEGQLSFSESSRPVKPNEFEVAQQLGFQLEQVPVAIDGIALAVNPILGIPGLSIDQIKAIYTNQVTNWSELGGPNLPIQAYSRSLEDSGTAKFFLESTIEADAYGDAVQVVDDTTTGLKQVIGNPGGIYYASAPEIINQCSIYALPLAAQSQPDTFIAPFADTWRTGNDCLAQRNTVNTIAFRDGNYPLTRRLFVVIKVDGAIDEAAGRAYVDMLASPAGQALIEQAGFVGVR